MAKIYYTSSNFRYTHTKRISGAEISCSLLICEMCVQVFACVCRCEFMYVCEGWSLMLDVFLDNSTLFTETRYLIKPSACWLHWSSRMAYLGTLIFSSWALDLHAGCLSTRLLCGAGYQNSGLHVYAVSTLSTGHLSSPNYFLVITSSKLNLRSLARTVWCLLHLLSVA